MVGQYLQKKLKFNFCYSALKKQIFLTSKQGHFNLLCSKLFYASIYLDERRPQAWAYMTLAKWQAKEFIHQPCTVFANANATTLQIYSFKLSKEHLLCLLTDQTYKTVN
jgi:hypothetical protein